MVRAQKQKRSTSHARDFIRVRGARVHNLKNINADIPKGRLVVVTGLSGSGKSSFAFDTIFAEAERRYVESLSAYARQFLGVKDKPDVESIDGLSPAISIDQKSVARNPRSTVGTITEIYDYLRILYARVGKPHCPQCGKPVGKQTADQIVDAIVSFRPAGELVIAAPLVRGKKGEHKNILEEARRAGFMRARIDGVTMLLDEALARTIDKKKKHDMDIVVDRFKPGKDIERSRIRDSVETALKMGKGVLTVAAVSRREGNERIFSEHFACTACGISIPDIEPRTFSFNSPYGACPACTGLGSTLEVDPKLVFPNPRLSIAEGAIRPWASASHRVGRQSWYWWILEDLASRKHFSLSTPVGELSEDTRALILYGDGEEKGFEGVISNLKRRWKETESEFTRAEIEKYMVIRTCVACSGARLKPEALAVTVAGEHIAHVTRRTVEDAIAFFSPVASGRAAGLSKNDLAIATPLVKEIMKRLGFLKDVGLEYLAVDRESTTLSGGESQRIQLATQIGSRLTGIIYVLDEPSIGLHLRDQSRLIRTLKDLRDLGNTVIVVEHDAETMREADWIIELGPGAGRHGGSVVFEGTPVALTKSRSITGEYLSGRKRVEVGKEASKMENQAPKTSGFAGQINSEKFLEIKGATEHNLKRIDVQIPLGKFVCVTGVSGSGKSTLVNDILAKSLQAKFHHAHLIPGAHDTIMGTEHLDKVVVVDQSPIGRTPRSNPATYTGAFGHIRGLFASVPESRVRGYQPGRFSFNVKGGRCETCEGQGVKKIEMYFLPDVYVECEECRGTRYNKDALEITYPSMGSRHDKNIAEILAMSIEDALKFFREIPAVRAKLDTLVSVGLGYLKLGQSAPTLSGGEAQRVKLATELSRRDTGRTLYILDEPTTGLHFDDIQKLLTVLSELVRRGNTVLVIEHNLDVVRNADWIIDLGPEGGEAGGRVVAEGTPKDIARTKKSYTGQWLQRVMQRLGTGAIGM